MFRSRLHATAESASLDLDFEVQLFFALGKTAFQAATKPVRSFGTNPQTS